MNECSIFNEAIDIMKSVFVPMKNTLLAKMNWQNEHSLNSYYEQQICPSHLKSDNYTEFGNNCKQHVVMFYMGHVIDFHFESNY